ncbi:hypothetical protein MUK42_05465 [Musa troglodytarum]|uniref:C2 NT-type domain-containing protein n=1 Tax=Musa troglodytarum TaxID=320322 RepID=A0A9E7JKY2_9LILI|nr:hypothetical protein MUK42_05465 [Musa troglodytarum]
MFKLHRYRSDRFGEKVEFKLSNLQAVKVPRGWDKLLLSIVSVESGKTIARTGRATVRSGNCQWTETESIWVSQDDTSKELEECRFKIVVSPASSRTVVIGEVTLNLADYLSSGETGPLLLPLKKCDSGTTLQDTSFSASGSRHSSDSGDSLSRTGLSPKNNLNGGQYIGRQDSSGSHISATYSTGPGGSNPSSFNSRASVSSVHNNQWQDMAAQTSEHGTMPSLRPSDSSKDFLESAEEIEELRDEVKMWERHSQQLKLDLELLKKENSEKSKHQVNLDRQLSAASSERDSLKLEVERLKAALEESTSKQTDIINFKNEDLVHIQKELEDELKFQKDSNANLTQQLSKTQESNIELVAILQELEEITEKQRLEIANLSQQKSVDESEKQERSQKSLENESEWERKVSLKEEETVLLESPNIVKNERQYEYDGNHSDLIKEVEKEKCQLEEDLASLRRESSDTSKHLEHVEHDLMVLTGHIEYHVSSNKALERKSMELESCKNELELHVSELEQDNVKLSERISGLEAQLRYITNEKESNRLELEDTITLIEELKDEVEQQRDEMEMQKAELKQKLQETQKRLSEALEESDISRRSNLKLQATIENLIEECNSLQNLTGDLKRQKLELHERITRLEVDLNESKKKNFDFCDQIDLFELKLSSLQKDIGSKEKSLLSQLEKIFQDHKEHEDKIAKITVEVENLEKEIADLTAQMSLNHDEREKVASDAIHEASLLRSEKARLECSLQEVNSKVELYETDLQALQQESKNKIQGLVDLLNASKQSEEMLMTDIEHMQRIMEGVKSSEDKYRKLVTDLELRLKTSDYEKQHAMEEISGLEVQLQKLSHLQNSVLDLKGSLDEADFEKRKLVLLLESVTQESEELKAENALLMGKVSSMQKALSDGHDDRRSKIALQEKLVRLESDLSVKEASYVYEAELKNELSRIKRTNSEYQRMFQNLEQENVELMNKVQNMEEELMLRKTAHQDEKISSEDEGNSCDHTEVPNDGKEVDHESDIPLHGTEHTEAGGVTNMQKEQLKRGISRKQPDNIEALKKTLNENADKISSLETELKDMRERYLHMSLQYAEVEAQREELVMQLKSVKKEKRWFS